MLLKINNLLRFSVVQYKLTSFENSLEVCVNLKGDPSYLAFQYHLSRQPDRELLYQVDREVLECLAGPWVLQHQLRLDLMKCGNLYFVQNQ